MIFGVVIATNAPNQNGIGRYAQLCTHADSRFLRWNKDSVSKPLGITTVLLVSYPIAAC